MFRHPIFFERNRVGRVYTGGLLFADFFGDPAEDGYFPEEWIASAVKAVNQVQASPKEGVSKIEGTDLYFDQLLQEHPEELLGQGNQLRILVKALDSAIRLPAQAHPDKAFSKKHFNSTFGKTECWLILQTRPGAKLFFGFKPGVTQSQFEAAIDQSEQDPDAMERLMETITPKPGEVYFVPAKTVHAIGKGCLILEVQEPTDFTIQPERYCGSYRLSDKEMYMGLTRQQAVSCFDFCPAPNAELTPVITEHASGLQIEQLVGPTQTNCFVINRITLSGGQFVPWVQNSYAIYIVTKGNGTIHGEGYSRTISKGEYFFMPAAGMGQFTITGNAELIECY